MEESGRAGTLMEVVLRFFEKEQWHYQVLEQGSVVRSAYRGERGTWVCYARVDEDNLRFLFYSLLGMEIVPALRLAVAEYLTRVNFNLPVGNFEIHLDTGEVRVKTAYAGPAEDLTVEIVHALVYANLHAMDQYSPGVAAIVSGGFSPEEALSPGKPQDIAPIPE